MARPLLAMVDVDGTLRNPDGWLPGARDLLAFLDAERVPVALCSGRPAHTLTALADEIGHVDHVAGGGGSAVKVRRGDDWVEEGRHQLPDDLVAQVQEQCRAIDLELWAYTPDEWLVHAPSPKVDRERDIIGFGARQVADFTGHEVVKLMMLPEDDPRHDRFGQEVPERFPGVVAVSSAPGYLDVIDQAALDSKGGDLLLASLGIDWADVLAIGDGPNDVGMIGKAGLGVCLPALTRSALPSVRGTVLEAKDRFDAVEQLRGRW